MEPGEAIGDGLKRLADCIEMVLHPLETEVWKVVGAEFVAQERGELLILLEEGSLEIGAEDMMAMLDLIDNGGELAAVPAVQAGAENLGEPDLGGEPPQAGSQLRSNSLWMGKLRLKMKLRQYSIWLIA